MAEPAELLLIRDQYELAFHSVSRGLTAEGAGQRDEALASYKKGRQHLTQGLQVPTGGARHHGAPWDTARLLQQKMRETLRTVDAHLSELEAAATTTEGQRGRLLKDLPSGLYPDLDPNSRPPQSSLHHLYPTVPSTMQTLGPTPTPTHPRRPGSPAALLSHKSPPEAPGALGALGALLWDRPPAYSLQPTEGPRSPAGPEAGGNQLLYIPSGVQMFFVAPGGQVSSLFYPGYLRIVVFDEQKKDPPAGRPPAYLRVCDWLYPLTADTPVLLANSGIFMFPDTLASTPGSFVGIVLSSELPAAARQEFQNLLSQLTDLRVQAPEGEEGGTEVIELGDKVPLGPPLTEEKDKLLLPAWSEKMAQSILSGATKLSLGLVRGAEATSRAIHKGAAKMRDNMTPEETATEVSPSVHKGLHRAQKATGGAVRVSQFLVNGVSTVAGHVADKVAPHVKKQGAKLVPESMKTSKDGKPSNLSGVKLVAVSSIHGLSTVWSSLETGAKHVGKSVSSETVTTVTHKYGSDAGQATDTALKSVVNVGMAAYNIDNLGVKAFMETAGKKTAKALMKNKEAQEEDKQGQQGQQEDAERLKTEEEGKSK
ncbi:spartin-like isoform X2 [Genypterus blacodes]